MEIYLMRHAEALLQAEWGQGDSSRPLSAKGQRQLEEAAPHIQKTDFRPVAVICSPYVRAVQTATILTRALGKQMKVVQQPELSAGANAEVYRKAAVKAGAGPVLFVGHMPDLAVFAARVIGDPRIVDTGIRTGEVVALEAGSLEKTWGEGKILWRRTLGDWKT